jgi:hypothetical protein
VKKWYESKIVWAGILQALVGILSLVAAFFDAGNYTPQAITLLVMGALTVALRIWFTDTGIES